LGDCSQLSETFGVNVRNEGNIEDFFCELLGGLNKAEEVNEKDGKNGKSKLKQEKQEKQEGQKES